MKPLDLVEAIEARPSALTDDGTALIHIIRPGLGMGRGNHFYPATMLQENAQKFTGWNVYLDHESPDAKRARGGLPRSMRDLGGIIEESWWDNDVPADGRHEQGAVVGRLRPIRELKEIVEELPEAAKFSIKARATDVAEAQHEGRHVWMVEGISDTPPGSVDAVTQAGAGGAILKIQEGLADEDIEQEELVLAEAKLDAAAHKKAYQPTKAATSPPEGEGGNEVFKELEEALRDPDSAVSQAVKDLVEARAAETVDDRVQEAVNAAEERGEKELTEAVEFARNEERERAGRERQLNELREKAHEQIAEAKLPEKLAKRLQESYEVKDGEPTESLDLSDRKDTEGQVVESAEDQLKAKLETDIQEARDLLAELSPAKVEGDGAGGGSGSEDGTTDPPKTQAKEKPFWKQHLEEAQIDPDEAFALSGAGSEE